MRPTPYVSSLRIYEPFESFNLRDQNLWSTEFSNLQTVFEEQSESLHKTITLNYSYSKIIENNGINKIFKLPIFSAVQSEVLIYFSHI